jgi:hypothetical protein
VLDYEQVACLTEVQPQPRVVAPHREQRAQLQVFPESEPAPSHPFQDVLQGECPDRTPVFAVAEQLSNPPLF